MEADHGKAGCATRLSKVNGSCEKRVLLPTELKKPPKLLSS